MIGKDFIEAVRENASNYPQVCSTLITLYDGKDHIDSREKIEYVEDLFKSNPKSKEDFLIFLDELEKNPVHYMNVKIDEYEVVVFYKTINEKTFSRKAPVSPSDYYMS